MRNIEIPLVRERDRVYRLFEMLPGILSWGTLLLPIALSFFNPKLAAYFIIAFLLMWFIKTIVMNIRIVQGYYALKRGMAYDWQKLLRELDGPAESFRYYDQGISPDWHRKNLINICSRDNRLYLEYLYHAVIIAISIEGQDVVEPTIKSVIKSAYDLKRIMLFIAYEERCKPQSKEVAEAMVAKYAHKFGAMQAIEHPQDLPDEMIGKGANITFAGHKIKQLLDKRQVDYKNVIVTTLDSDNRPHPQYFAAVSYAYMACPDPLRVSFQPPTLYTNNIWDVPAPMRVIATGNSFWNMVLAMRPHMLRNFSAHSQGMQALVDSNFWSVRTIVEDGHQFWRTYFTFSGHHEAYSIMVPVYIDAVLSSTLKKTIKSQFIQIRRWAWGASDIAYVLQKGWREKNLVPKWDLFFKTCRLIENHLSWATAPLLLLLGAFIPLYITPHARTSLVANQLPIIASRIQTIAMVGLLISIYFSIKLLPPKPLRYKNRHRLYMIAQWVWLPVTTIVFNSFAALYSQTRLMFGWYLGKFDITEKAVKK